MLTDPLATLGADAIPILCTSVAAEVLAPAASTVYVSPDRVQVMVAVPAELVYDVIPTSSELPPVAEIAAVTVDPDVALILVAFTAAIATA